MTTADIKSFLEKKGYKQIKRTKKHKQNNCWIREYTTSTDNISVVTNESDDTILEVKSNNNTIIGSNVIPECTPKNIKKAKDLREIKWNCTEEEIRKIIEHFGRERFFQDFKTSNYKHIGFIYNIDGKVEFLILSNDMISFSIVQFSYGFTAEVKSVKFKPAPRNLKCIALDDPDELSGQEWIVPEGYLCLDFSPEYMNFVAVSPCLKYGMASLGTVESDTFTTKKDIIEIFGVNKMADGWFDMEDDNVRKFVKKYDVLNVSM